MSWLEKFVSNPVGTLTDTVSNLGSTIGNTVDSALHGDVGSIAALVAGAYGAYNLSTINAAMADGLISEADAAAATSGATTGGGFDAAATAAANTAGNYTAGIAGAMTGGDAATTSLVQKLASLTGLSTSAIERLGGAAISSLASGFGASQIGQASMDAANRLAAANQSATQLQSQMYNDLVARQQPFYQAGVNALGPYTTGIMGTQAQQAAGQPGALVRPFDITQDYTQSPWYQVSLDKKLKDYTNKMASMGLVDSGPTRRGVLGVAGQAGQEDITNAYNRYVNNQATQRNALAGLTGFAPTAAQQIGSAGTNYATNVNNLATNTATNYANADLTGAAARQSAYTGAGGAFANALSPNPLNAYLNKQLGLA